MMFPKTIRMDASDTHAFQRAAEPGEWAVAGAFAFAEFGPDELTGKIRQAFRNGFLGTDSFGWSTFVSVAPINEVEYEALVGRLADHFVAHYGAPTREQALTAAREEADFAAGLCEHPVNTVLTVARELGPDGIVENFRIVESADDRPATVWKVEDDKPDA